MLNEAHFPLFVMLSGAKHPCTGFLADARNDTFGFVMLNEVKHPCIGLWGDRRRSDAQ